MTFAADMRLTAQNLIADFGTTVTLRVKTLAAVYVAGLQRSAVASTEDIVVKVSPPVGAESDVIDGTRIKAGDMFCWVAAADVVDSGSNELVPETDWLLLLNNEAWNIVNVQTIYAGDPRAAYKLHIRR